MTEDQLRQVERWLDCADAKAVADVAFAAIMRLGFHAEGTDRLVARASDLTGHDIDLWEEGVALIEDAATICGDAS